MSTEASGSSTTMDDVQEMMEELSLKEDDLDDVVFEEEEAPTETDVRWMAIVRVHMQKTYSQN